MSDRLKLLRELKDASYEAALFGSYNVSFPFFEQVVLRGLRSHGCDHNVLLMDAAQCATTLLDPELGPRSAGRLYGLAPITTAGAFHPKFILLLGKRHSKLFVGSHNLTLSGFGLNREVSNVLPVKGVDAKALAQSVFKFAQAWAGTVGEEFAELVASAGSWASWLDGKPKPPEELAILGTTLGGPTLWEQAQPWLDRDATEVAVLGPYFDEKLRFLQVVREFAPQAEITVGVSPRFSEINPAAARALNGVTFRDISAWLGDDASRLVHAKLMLFSFRNGESVLVSGSANPSAPAWLDHPYRNAELVVLRRLAKNDPLPSELGLTALAALPEMTDGAWSVVSKRRETKEDEVETRRAWLAFERDGGFDVDHGFAAQGENIAVLGREDDLLASLVAPSGSNGRRHLPLSDHDLRNEASRLQVMRDGVVQVALVQHLSELRDRATSDERRSLRQALRDLDSKEDGLDGFLAIIEKAIFDSEPVPRESNASASPAKARPIAARGAVGVGELDKNGRRRPRLSSGDIGLVLDTLIHKLGEGLPSVGSAAKLSEEELEDETDVPTAALTVDEGHALAKRCLRKTRTLMRRMMKRLVAAWNEEAEPFSVLIQLVASLGLVHRLLARQHHFELIPRGAELVDEGALWELANEAAVTGFSPRHGLAGLLEEEHGEFDEVASACSLTLWSAWRCGLDRSMVLGQPRAFGDDENDEDEIEVNLTGLGFLLNCLDRMLLPPVTELARVFDDNGLDWLQRHLDWAEDVFTSPPTDVPVVRGSVVRFHRSATDQDVGVVVRAVDGKADVVDRGNGEIRAFKVDRVKVVGMVGEIR